MKNFNFRIFDNYFKMNNQIKSTVTVIVIIMRDNFKSWYIIEWISINLGIHQLFMIILEILQLFSNQILFKCEFEDEISFISITQQ